MEYDGKTKYYHELITDFKQSIEILMEDYISGTNSHSCGHMVCLYTIMLIYVYECR